MPDLSERPEGRPFHWFGPDSVAALREKLNAAGPGAILEVHQHGQDMTLWVVPAGIVALEGGGGVNESHICPPVCP